MGPTELLARVAPELDRLGIEYFVTGSVASGAWGEFRNTEDIDIVVVLGRRDVRSIINLFPAPEFYLSEDALIDAVENLRQFNVIQPNTGLKIDFMVVDADGFQGSCLARRRQRPVAAGVSAWFSAPDDLILNKLLFFREGRSEKHLRDIASILKISPELIDHAYTDEWALRLGVKDLWELVKERAKGPPNV